MPIWHITARFEGLQPAGETLRRLGAFFFSQPSFAAWRIVLPGEPAANGELILVIVATLDGRPDEYDRKQIAAILREMGGKYTDVPRILVDRCVLDWHDRLQAAIDEKPPPTPSLMFLSTLDNLADFSQQEDPLVVTSHGKCRDCGGQRHKIARLNLCQECWERVKPAVRRQWRDIKDRRRLREAVDTHPEEQRRQREVNEELVVLRQARNNARRGGVNAELSDQEVAKREIARMRAEGTIPAMGTPERAQYMRLHQIASGGQRRAPDDLDRLIGRLYTETRIQVKDICAATGTDGNRLRRVQFKLKIPNRDDLPDWHSLPKPPKDAKLLVVNGEAFYQLSDLQLVPVFDSPEQLQDQEAAQDEPEEEPAAVADEQPEELPIVAQEPEPIANGQVHDDEPHETEAPVQVKTYRSYTREERAEIARWYDDPSIPVSEISAAYRVPTSTITYIARQFGLTPRKERAGFTGRGQFTHGVVGRFELIDGKHQWVRGDPAQLHLGQAPTEPEEEPMPAQPEVVQPHAELKLAVIPNGHTQIRERAWAIRIVVERTLLVTAPDVMEAIRRTHEGQGDDVDIVAINPA